MRLLCRQSLLKGAVEIPGSKSHTIRAVAIASLADGRSRIEAPLVSSDTMAAVRAYRLLGAQIDLHDDAWEIVGTAGRPTAPDNVIDVGNSGTTMRIALGSCTLVEEGLSVLTGDDQIRRRPVGPLAESLNQLGAVVTSTRGGGVAPLVVSGRLRGGETSIEAVTSQYLTSLLMCTPLAEKDSTIHVPLLNEASYVTITLDWLHRVGIRLEHENMREFHVPGGQRYKTIDMRVPADFSSATFFLAAGALGDNDVLVCGLDMNDPQGDKAVIDYLRKMGAKITEEADGLRIHPGQLTGCRLDMNETPDALPMMAVVGCFARGKTELINVPQARYKETDRIAVMREELSRMGAKITELKDGLVIEESPLKPAKVNGHHDHRVVMALAVAATGVAGETEISTAEAMKVTFPEFVDKMTNLGGDLRMEAD